MAKRWLGYGAIAPLGVALLGILTLGLPARSLEARVTADPSAQPPDPLLAQVAGTCREVAPEGGLYVREAANVYSEAIAALPRGTQVTVQSLGDADWVPVSGPVSGYMISRYLVPCGTIEAAAVPTGTGICRQVLNEGGLYIREAPNAYSEAIAAVPMGAQVQAQASETDGWVPVSSPRPGFMFANYLGACS
ncbi:MAG: SH3 domain-containing protein [Synechococcales bacterium]|nr:SH3 domain-containing protein [Synechococcales bacterium]